MILLKMLFIQFSALGPILKYKLFVNGIRTPPLIIIIQVTRRKEELFSNLDRENSTEILSKMYY
jgi:hypothetical protein